MLDIKLVEEAFASLEGATPTEVSFQLGDQTVWMKHVGDDDEVNVTKFASLALEEGAEDGGTQQDFIHRFKVATLSYAIVQIGDVDLRTDRVDTGEGKLANGRPITREKSDVVRKFIAKWPAPFLSRAFAKYGELTTKVELEIEKLIQYEPVDFDAEIERLETRIKDLQELKGDHEKQRVDPEGSRIKAALNLNQASSEFTHHVAEGAEKARQQSQAPQQAPPARVEEIEEPRVLVTPPPEPQQLYRHDDLPPGDVPPYLVEGNQDPEPDPEYLYEHGVAAPTPSSQRPEDHYSPEQLQEALRRTQQFVDQPEPPPARVDPRMGRQQPQPSTPQPSPERSQKEEEHYARVQALQDQQAAEQRQAVEKRRAHKQEMRQAEGVSRAARRQQAAPMPVRRKRPPHAGAAEVADNLQSDRPTLRGTLPGAGPNGEDMPVYQMEPQTLSPRGRVKGGPSGEAQVNQTPRGTANPRFNNPRNRKK
jgi:hypothetical protein